MQSIESTIKEDLCRIGLDLDFNLVIKDYSKSYFGRYIVKTNTIVLYVRVSLNGDMYPYSNLLLTAVHEAVHCKQWNDPNYVRVKGVMHNAEFVDLYNKYSDRARAILLLREALNH